MRKAPMIIGRIFFIIGIIILFIHPSNITGFAISENFSFLDVGSSSIKIFGISFLLIGGLIMIFGRKKTKVLGLEEKLQRGKEVEMNVIFVRHGKRNEKGFLTREGRKQAKEYGKSLSAKDAIKGYSSPIQRALETTERIVKAAPRGKKLKTRIRNELSISGFSDDFNKEYLKQREKGADAVADWYFGLGDKRFDEKSPTYKEMAEGFAYLVQRSLKVSGRLNKGSKVDLINGTHGNLPEALLKEIMMRKDEKSGDYVRGFDSISEIGGSLGYAEPVDFKIVRDEDGEALVNVNFRGHTYEVDMKRLNTLADNYAKRVKGRTRSKS